jgi:hypothetical protein
MIVGLLAWLSSGVVKDFTGPLLDAYRLKVAAQNDAERIAAERQIASLEAARDIALAETADRWSATRLGRLLIVVPFGLWWTAVFMVSMLNPLLGLAWTIDDVPARFWDMAVILIPAVILGDAGALVARRFKR